MPRSAPTVVTLVLALATGVAVGRAAVPRFGDAIAHQMARMAAPIFPQADSPVIEAAAALVPAPPYPPPPVDEARRPRGNVRPASSIARPPPSEAALEISAERLAVLTEKQLRSLRAVDALDDGGRATGASLSGVRALGVGLDDGDVVTSIEGRPTLDVSTALAAAVQAYGSGRDTARATVRRAGRTVFVLVHIPRASSRPKG